MSSSEPASSSEPVRPPANDLVAFDISKQSPEQIAQLFARWKEQRKRLNAPEPPRSGRPPHLRPVPPIARGGDAARTETPPAVAEDGSIRYSAPFEALLTVHEPSLAARVWNPDARRQTLARPRPPRRRSRTKWMLAGAASVIAVAAMAGGAVWERGVRTGDKPDVASVAGTAAAAPPATPAYPTDIPLVEPFVATAVATGAADWPMRRTVDLALMKAAPVEETAPLALIPQLKPPVPVVHTASKPVVLPTRLPRPLALPQTAPVRQEAIARVELPLVPNTAPAPALVSPAAPVAAAPSEDPRPDGVSSRGNNKSNYTFGASERVAASDGTPTGGGASGGAAKTGSGSSGGASSGSDPTGGSGGDGSGSGDPGGGTGGDTGGSDTGGSGDGDTGGGDSGGDADGGNDAGGGDAGGGSGGDSDSGGGDSGGGDGGGGDSGAGDSSGGDSGGGDSGGSGDSGSGDGDSASSGGIGGAVGGAIGGLGDALGGGKGNADKDKSKDNGKAKDKSD